MKALVLLALVVLTINYCWAQTYTDQLNTITVLTDSTISICNERHVSVVARIHHVENSYYSVFTPSPSDVAAMNMTVNSVSNVVTDSIDVVCDAENNQAHLLYSIRWKNVNGTDSISLHTIDGKCHVRIPIADTLYVGVKVTDTKLLECFNSDGYFYGCLGFEASEQNAIILNNGVSAVNVKINMSEILNTYYFYGDILEIGENLCRVRNWILPLINQTKINNQ